MRNRCIWILHFFLMTIERKKGQYVPKRHQRALQLRMMSWWHWWAKERESAKWDRQTSVERAPAYTYSCIFRCFGRWQVRCEHLDSLTCLQSWQLSHQGAYVLRDYQGENWTTEGSRSRGDRDTLRSEIDFQVFAFSPIEATVAP